MNDELPNEPESQHGRVAFEDGLAEEIAACIERGAGAPLSDAEFDRLARRVFAAQYEACAPYRAWCDRRRRAPAGVGHWLEIPAVPVTAFREVELRSDDAPAVRVFETSGTTSARRGRHALSARALALYERSMIASFRRFLLPELEHAAVGEARSALRAIVLGPPRTALPGSSLYYMCDGVCRALVRDAPLHVLGPGGLDLSALRAALAAAERDGRPLLLLGTALGWAEACARLEGRGERFSLPAGSRAMETGGTKGEHASFTPRALRERIAGRFGLEPAAIVGEYGMTEAGSQWYDDTWRAAAEAACEWSAGAEDETTRGERFKHGAPWARAVVCDPETLEPAPAGRPGVVRVVDLANRFTLSFLQTEDLAVTPEAESMRRASPGTAPFALLGRARGAEARGCSLVAEEWARMAGDR